MRVMIVVTHLLGTGHLRRAALLARAFADRDHAVTLVSGGRPLAGLDLRGVEMVQLPTLCSDGVDFARLLDDSGAPAEDSLLAARCDLLCQTLRHCCPDVLVTELYPFGRRVLRDEFGALLDAAQAQTPRPPLVLSSIRDILAPPSRPEKAAQAEAILTRSYDAVLVHSDPDAIRLDHSWPVSPALAQKLRYTGFIAPPPPAPQTAGIGADEILVSAGGGAVGTPLFRCAAETAALMPDRAWRLLLPPNHPDQRAVQTPAPNLLAEPLRPDFRSLLNRAAASVSLCGYNTAMDVLQTGVPAIFVPFDAGREVEQSLRAASLSRLDGVQILRSTDLSPTRLREAVETVLRAPKRPVSALRFDGAAQSVAIAASMRQAQE